MRGGGVCNKLSFQNARKEIKYAFRRGKTAKNTGWYTG